ncbi:MAG: Flp pilus assembly complex ATPase component TadA [Alphaproteobacteria bacterium]|nr:Flp pilus assembly complex ATPase component TadA [Alphaproteobacteria bacterium]
MEAGRPVSLLKKGIDDLKETWPGEPDRFQEIHVDSFLLWCVKRNASDITFQTSRTVYSEIYGVLYPATNRSIDGADMAAVVSRIYGAEALPILAGGKDIDLSYEIMIDRTHRTRFRVNMTAILADGRDGIQITMRVLPSSPPTMKTLKVDSEILKYWKPRQGIVLVTGPTGSGKTTLLAAGCRMLIESLHGCGKMLTYEAPIEFTYDTILSRRSLVAQTEIPRHLPTFADGVRNALRRKPEIILVGEARDRETISAAIEAGQTGHIVYATVHTTGVASTIRRMVATFEPNERTERAFALMETMRLIVTQTLVPKIGGGRTALREYMPFTEEIREHMLNLHFDKWSAELMQMVPKYGKTMESSAKEALDAGLIEKRHYLIYAHGTKALKDHREETKDDDTIDQSY